ncbi:MAG TPA: ATP-binding protein [Longimicrobium sp.]|nr:ATP-binding protein [Longimicrobium sp.]
MLMRFRAENFRAIKDEQELSLVASAFSEHEESLVRVPQYDLELLRVAGAYGANASGKSTLVEAIGFMQAAVRDSQTRWEPQAGVRRVPFAFDPACADAPSTFAVDLLLDGVRYEYGFVADSLRVREEWLFAWPKGRRQEWFTRDADRDEEFAFSRLLSGENRAIGALTRPNSLFLSAAAQNNHEMLSPVHQWFAQQLLVVGDWTRGALAMLVSQRCRDAAYRENVFQLLKTADLGISGLELTEDEGGPTMSRLFGAVAGLFGDGNLRDIRLLHRTGEGGEVALPFSDESAGTRALFGLAGAIVDVLSSGGTLVVDELDRSLHPHLSTHIVRTFNDPVANPRNAQLVFNTHDTNLLDAGILRRDQVWFTEKGGDGATHLFPLTDFRARKYENLERGYLQGRYGAVPSLGPLAPPRGAGS